MPRCLAKPSSSRCAQELCAACSMEQCWCACIQTISMHVLTILWLPQYLPGQGMAFGTDDAPYRTYQGEPARSPANCIVKACMGATALSLLACAGLARALSDMEHRLADLWDEEPTKEQIEKDLS